MAIYQTKTLSVDDQSPTRLDRYLKRIYPGLNQGIIEKLIRTKKILCNNQKTSSSQRVCSPDTVQIPENLSSFAQKTENSEKKPLTISPADVKKLKSWIIWEDDEMLVLNKPHGIAAQGGTGQKISIDAIAKAYNPEARLTHRIDKNTSGILLLAKTREFATFLTGAFKEKKIKKTYRAVVEGRVDPAQGIIDLPIGKTSEIGSIEQMVVGGENAKPAQTQYILRKPLRYNLSLVDCWPKTGRTHQLRIHFSHLGWPIYGDGKYGSKHRAPMHLHAFQLEFSHPTGGKFIFEAPLPEGMVETLVQCGLNADNL